MSVDLSFYTMFGLKSDYYEDFIDAYNEMYETKHGNTIEVLMDVMCGEYIAFSHRDDGFVLFDFCPVTRRNFFILCLSIKIDPTHTRIYSVI